MSVQPTHKIKLFKERFDRKERLVKSNTIEYRGFADLDKAVELAKETLAYLDIPEAQYTIVKRSELKGFILTIREDGD